MTGKGEKYRKIDVGERIQIVGKERSKGLIGLHNFSGADWGGKFAGISKNTWIKSYLALDKDDMIIKSFQMLGEVSIKWNELMDCEIPIEFIRLEKFTCLVYCSMKTSIRFLKNLRWELFRTKILDGSYFGLKS